MAAAVRGSWARFVALARPLFRPPFFWPSALRLGLLVGLLLGVTGLNVVNSYVGRDFMTSIADRRTSALHLLALLYLSVFAASTVVAVYQRFTEQHLGLLWREWLTRHLSDRYLADHAYYRINERGEVDNPDQRLAEDVRTFTTTALSFVLILLNSAITLLAFAGILASITPWLLLAAVGYAALGSLMTVLLGRRLVGLNFLQLKKEADLRYELIRVREHAQPIALQRDEARARRRIGARLAEVVANFRDIIAVSRNLGFFTNGYNYLIQLIPVLIVAPLYIRGEVEFGVVTQAAMAFAMVMNAFSVFIEQFQAISSFAAVVTRLGSLQEAIEAEAAARPAIEIKEDGERVAFERLTLTAPTGRTLVRDLTLEVRRGQRLLITGPSGTGRSSLLCATAGLWQAGSGRVVRPPLDDVAFLHQQPYLVPGSLRDELLPPGAPGVPDERLLADPLEDLL